MHGAPLVAALRERLPGVTIEALGGPRIAAAGATVRFPSERYTVMGFTEVLTRLPAHLALLSELRRQAESIRERESTNRKVSGSNPRATSASTESRTERAHRARPARSYGFGGARKGLGAARSLSCRAPFEESRSSARERR